MFLGLRVSGDSKKHPVTWNDEVIKQELLYVEAYFIGKQKNLLMWGYCR